jgi:hypothetical protein
MSGKISVTVNILIASKKYNLIRAPDCVIIYPRSVLCNLISLAEFVHMKISFYSGMDRFNGKWNIFSKRRVLD